MNLLHYFPVVYLDRQLSRELTHCQADLYDRVVVMGWNESRRKMQIVDAHHPRGNLSIVLLPGVNLRVLHQVPNYPILIGGARFLERYPFDLLHINSHLNIQSQCFARRANRKGKPVVMTIHGVMAYYDTFLDSLQRAYLETLRHTLLNHVDHVICLTRSDCRDMIHLGLPFHKVSIIPNGVNEVFFSPAAKRDERTVVWHGRFIPQKGLADLVRSSRLVTQALPDAKYKLMGWGPQTDFIAGLVSQMNLSRNFIFLGKVPWEDVPRNLSSSCVYSMPSYREGMPYALLESMACGTPAVAYSIPGVSDVIEHGIDGFLVERGDYRSMARYVTRLLLDKKLRTEMGKNARRKIETSYTWKSIALKHDQVYRQLIDCSSLR